MAVIYVLITIDFQLVKAFLKILSLLKLVKKYTFNKDTAFQMYNNYLNIFTYLSLM